MSYTTKLEPLLSNEIEMLEEAVLARLANGDQLKIIQFAIYDCFGEQLRLWECQFSSGANTDPRIIHSLLCKNAIERHFYTMTCEEFILKI